MRVIFTDPFSDRYRKLSGDLKKKFEKQVRFLLKNIRHPSLRAKKYDEARDIWQARVDDDYRFYFKIERDIYYILSIIKHPK